MNKRQMKKFWKKPRCSVCKNLGSEFEHATYSFNFWCKANDDIYPCLSDLEIPIKCKDFTFEKSREQGVSIDFN